MRYVRLQGGWLDSGTGSVHVQMRKPPLTALEQSLLVYLARRSPDPVGKQELLDQVWGYSARVNSDTVKTTVSRVRRKLGRAAEGIRTVRGAGYAIRALDDRAPPSGDVALALVQLRSTQLDSHAESAQRAADRVFDRLARPDGFAFVDAPMHLAVAFEETEDATQWALAVLASLPEGLEGRAAVVAGSGAQPATYGGPDRDRLHAMCRSTPWGGVHVGPQVSVSDATECRLAALQPSTTAIRTPTPPRHQRREPSSRPEQPPRTSELPHWHTSWLGRQDEEAQVHRLMQAHDLVCLVGAGGMGKTRLARRVVGDRRAVWIDLDGRTDRAAVSQALCDRLDLGPSSSVDVLRRALAELEPLLVVDGAESAPAALASLLSDLVGRTGATRWLITSRVPLGAPGEWVYRLGPMAPAAARRLLCERASAALGEAVLDDATIAALVERLDRIPLALELAAPQVAALGADAVLQAMHDRLAVLERDGSRHGSFETVLRACWERLDPFQQTVLMRCALFEGPFAWTDAAELIDASPAAVRAAVADLVRRSLLQREGETLRMLETVRAFAQARLRQSRTGPSARREHARWALGLVHAARGNHGSSWRKHLAARERDVHAAIGFAVRDDPADAVEALRVLSELFDIRGVSPSVLATIQDAVEATRTAHPHLHAVALLALAKALAPLGRGSEALAAVEDAALLAQRDSETEVAALVTRAMVRDGWGSPAYARTMAELLPRVEETLSPEATAQVLLKMVTPHTIATGTADAYLQRAAEIQASGRDDDLKARVLLSRARVAHERFDYLGLYQTAVPARRLLLELGRRVRAAYSAGLAARAVHALGDGDRAVELYQTALREGRAVGVFQPGATQGLARLHLVRGEWSEARTQFERMVQSQDLGAPLFRAHGLVGLGSLAEYEGQPLEALGRYLEAFDLVDSESYYTFRAVVNAHLAGVMAELGQVDRARDHLERARRVSSAPWMPLCWRAAAARVDRADAAAVLAELRASPHRVVSPLWHFEQCLAAE